MVVGMPYPNMKSMELQEKIKYLNQNDSSITGNQYYENLCMKAVNQCIGLFSIYLYNITYVVY